MNSAAILFYIIYLLLLDYITEISCCPSKSEFTGNSDHPFPHQPQIRPSGSPETEMKRTSVERNSLTDNTLPTLRAAKGEHVKATIH